MAFNCTCPVCLQDDSSQSSSSWETSSPPPSPPPSPDQQEDLETASQCSCEYCSFPFLAETDTEEDSGVSDGEEPPRKRYRYRPIPDYHEDEVHVLVVDPPASPDPLDCPLSPDPEPVSDTDSVGILLDPRVNPSRDSPLSPSTSDQESDIFSDDPAEE